MFVLSNAVSAFAHILDIILNILFWVILIRALLSWVNPDPNNAIVRLINQLSEPILSPIRRLLPFSLKMTLDISPIIAFLIIMFLRMFLVKTLIDLSLRM